MSKDRIGLKSVPPDVVLEEWLYNLFLEYRHETDNFGIELMDTIMQTHHERQPHIFAFAKMLNKLATMEKPDLIKILSAAMWHALGEEDGT